MNRNIIRGILFFSTLKELFNELNNSLPYALIKGEALSLQAYKKIGQRRYGDIDILIDRNDLNLIKSIFNKHGFYQDSGEDKQLSRAEKIYASLSHQSFPFKKVVNHFTIEIDLNVDLFWGEYNKQRIDINTFLSDCKFEKIYECDVKVLPIDKAFTQLCLHHYKEFNSFDHIVYHNPLTNQAFSDVYYLIKNNADILHPESIYRIAKEYGVIPYVYYVLFYTNEIFDDDILKESFKKLDTKEGVNLLNQYGLLESEKKEWKVDFETRKNAQSLYEYFKDDLTPKDIEKIELHKKIF